MRRAALLAVLLALAPLGAPPAAAAAGGVLNPPWTGEAWPGEPEVEAAILRYVNTIREAEGVRQLRANPALTVAAREHAWEMHELGYFGHTSPVKAHADPRHRAHLAGYLTFVAENAVDSFERPDPDEIALGMVDAWMNSPKHKKNLLDPTHREVGTGVYRKGDDAKGVQVFASGEDFHVDAITWEDAGSAFKLRLRGRTAAWQPHRSAKVVVQEQADMPFFAFGPDATITFDAVIPKGDVVSLKLHAVSQAVLGKARAKPITELYLWDVDATGAVPRLELPGTFLARD